VLKFLKSVQNFEEKVLEGVQVKFKGAQVEQLGV
jgi:hypothetical protein